MSGNKERILDLCRQVSEEKDSSKMTDLVEKLNRELDRKKSEVNESDRDSLARGA